MHARSHWATNVVCVIGALCIGALARAQPPILYSQPGYQSPVRGEPDDLLMLPGFGFAKGDVVVYARLADTTRIPKPPTEIPASSSAAQGVARVVSYHGAPNALTVLLPVEMSANQSYVLWARNSQREWSNPVRINDARPMWLTPAFAYSSAQLAGLPRQIKIVGRNLQSASGASVSVRLSGPQQLVLRTQPEDGEEPALREYVAKAALPPRLAPGAYTIEISRDGASWVSLGEQQLIVQADPDPRRKLAVEAEEFGGCHPDDGRDDTVCIVRAVRKAADGGGIVTLGPGVWDLTQVSEGVKTGDGILIPQNVDLQGAGSEVTRVLRHESWKSGGGTDAVFTLIGHNVVSGFTFADAHVSRQGDAPRPTLQVGMAVSRVAVSIPRSQAVVEDVVITGNVFDRTSDPIIDGGLPMRRLFITRNELGAFHEALLLGGSRFSMTWPFRLDDSVIAYNIFKPGSSLDAAHGQGTIASEIGASHRVDFSHNIADGTSTQYLNAPTDARGWRAAFFWHMNGSHEMSLISENRLTCTGDKAGDGEAIAYDNNANTFALSDARTVLGATAATVTVAGPLKARQNNRDVAVASYYVGHWIQLVAGPGLGQVRKISAYRIDSGSGNVTFTVSPAWDVPPQAGHTRMGVGRQFWQVYTLANVVDHRQPLCLKSNRTRPKGGVIGLWAQIADSVVAGNRQYDTDGILMQNAYVADDPECKECVAQNTFQSFVEIRNNLVHGEYQWDSACSISGIMSSYAAAPTPSSPPPVLGFGLTIAHNTVRQADGFLGGAIDFASTWYKGPPPYRWVLIDNALIQHNVIRDITESLPKPACRYRQVVRAGVRLDAPFAMSRTVLYGNACENVAKGIEDYGTDTVRVCPAPVKASCECRSLR